MQYDDGVDGGPISPNEIVEVTRVLRARLRSRGVDAHMSEDVVQEAWLRALRRDPKGSSHLRGWMYVATERITLAMRRTNRNRRQRELDIAPVESTIDDDVAATEATLLGWVDQLPSPYVEVLKLRFAEDREIAEIARILGRPEVTVRTQLKRGLDRLRARIDGAEGPPRRSALSILVGWFTPRDEVAQSTVRMLRALAIGVPLAATLLVVLWFRGSSRPASVAATRGDAVEERVAAVSVPDAGDAPEKIVAVDASTPKTAGVFHLAGVVRAPDGTRVAGAAVMVGSADGSRSRIAARTDAEGRFAIERVDAADFVWAAGPRWFESRRRFACTQADPERCDLALSGPGRELAVRVTSADGEPVAGAEVFVLDPLARDGIPRISIAGAIELLPSASSAWTDAEGRVEVPLPDADRIHVRILAEGGAAWMSDVSIAELGPGPLVARLAPPITLTGRIADAVGGPAGNALVELVQGDGLVRHETRSAADGSFKIEGASVGGFLLLAGEDSAVGDHSCRREGVLRADEDAEIVLERTSTIRGRAVDAPPHSIVRLTVLGQPARPWETRTTCVGADGTFSFPGCAADRTHRVDLLEPGESLPSAWDKNVRSGGDAIVLVRSAHASERGSFVARFERADGAILPTFAELRSGNPPMSVMRPVDPTTGTATFEDVSSELDSLRAWIPRVGTWNAGMVTHEMATTRTCHALVPRPGRVAFVFDLPRDMRSNELRGIVTSPGFCTSAIAGVQNRMLSREVAVDARGRAELELMSGEYDYAFQVDGGAELTGTIRVEEGVASVVPLRPDLGYEVEIALHAPRPFRAGESHLIAVRTPRGSRTVRGRDAVWEGGVLRAKIRLPRDTIEVGCTTAFGMHGSTAVSAPSALPDDALPLVSIRMDESP